MREVSKASLSQLHSCARRIVSVERCEGDAAATSVAKRLWDWLLSWSKSLAVCPESTKEEEEEEELHSLK